MSPRFALLGAAGYVAPRHLAAIAEMGGTLVAACDPHDSVGILDRHFFDARYFREFERFDRFLEKLRQRGEGVDYVSICSPNYLHDAHIRAALRLGAHAICEKPLVINPWNLEQLSTLATEYGREVYPILQLRRHPAMRRVKAQVEQQPERHFQVELTYITPRGAWYSSSWKGDESRSGGLVTNIGVHLLDILGWLFGAVEHTELHVRDERTWAGSFSFERADVVWLLSVDNALVPGERRHASEAHRSFLVDGDLIDCSDGFGALHTEVYRRILSQESERLNDARPAIELSRALRDAAVVPPSSLRHPLVSAGPLAQGRARSSRR